MKGFALAVDKINLAVGKAASWLIMAMMLIMVYEVVLRYFLNAPTLWAGEVSQYLLAGVVMLGGGYCLAGNGHVRVDIFYQRYGPRAKAWVELLGSAMVIVFVAAMLWKGADLCWEALMQGKRSMTILELPLFPSMAAVPVGGSLLGLQALARALKAAMLLKGINDPELRAMYEE